MSELVDVTVSAGIRDTIYVTLETRHPKDTWELPELSQADAEALIRALRYGLHAAAQGDPLSVILQLYGRD